MHLYSAGLKESRFIEARKAVCEEVLKRFAAQDDLLAQNFRRALGETVAQLGNPAGADECFQEWLGADPEWGWGWIGWSDCYWLLGRQSRDLRKAENLLRRGLAVQGVRDRTDLLERLKDVCEESGKEEEAAALNKEIESLQGPRSGLECSRCGEPPSALEEDPPAWPLAVEPLRAEKKPGRNDPCACGSGKKSKKCCG
jgi:tetratricopeptide (TPR) repeat protein